VVAEALTYASLRALAPAAFTAWDTVLASVDAAVPAGLVALVREEVGGALGSAPVPAERGDRGACRALVEQFVVDVGAVTDGQRSAALVELGDDAFGFMQVCYVTDLDARIGAAWSQLFGVEREPVAAHGTELWPALEGFMRAVALLPALDPVTTEVVRLRGARSHRCRMCQSRRSVPAAANGADESLYDQIDHYESSALSRRHKVALRLVDAILWEPRQYPDALINDVQAQFSPEEIVELVLDVARNAANKIAVAFAADAPTVSEGVELYDIDERGDVVFGLNPTT